MMSQNYLAELSCVEKMWMVELIDAPKFAVDTQELVL
jgi:hypothetical protein